MSRESLITCCIKHAWHIGYTVEKILSSDWGLYIIKWFKRQGVKDLSELAGDAMKYLTISGRLLQATRMKTQDAKISKLEYYIANVKPSILATIQGKKMPKCIRPHLNTLMSFGSWRALTLLRTRSQKLGDEVAS